jgi:hypothetical protein
MENDKPFCCFLTCDRDAEWQIEVDNQPIHPSECDTQACSLHVGLLLWDNGQHRVYPIAG